MARTVVLNTVYTDQFPALEIDGITKTSGLTVAGGDFTFTIWNNGTVSSVVPTITEIASSGEYRFQLTPNALGFWKVEIYDVTNEDFIDIEFDCTTASVDSVSEIVNNQTERATAVVGRQVSLSLFQETALGAPETGLTLASFTPYVAANGQAITATGPYNIQVTEIHATNAPGEYAVSITPQAEGLLLLRLDRPGARNRYAIRVERRSISDLNNSMIGGSTKIKINTQTAAAVAIPSVQVRLMNSADTTLVTQGNSDSTGVIYFDLLPGTYRAYLSKEGYDFSAVSPATLVVPTGVDEAPVISTFAPSSIASGGTLALRGKFFHTTAASNTVNFTTSSGVVSVAATGVDAVGELLSVTVPAIGAVTTSVTVSKPDTTTPTPVTVTGGPVTIPVSS